MTRETARTGDPHSYARPAEARVRRVRLDLAVDFERRVLAGSATLSVEAEAGAALVLDTRRLAIAGVHDVEGRVLAHTLAPEDPLLGSALTIALGAAREIVVSYETSPDAPGLQWLAPAQTFGGAAPFLFTQGHAIETRSWIPLQDSPGLRVTYAARVRVPATHTALMSAAQRGDEGAPGGERAFSFAMDEPIPPYLIALAVGRLARREVGPRTAVFAEPEQIDAAAWELGELERFVEAAEQLLGPYGWGRFDVLVMPRSFPYGGMENPRLVFASPSLIAGDRSLVTVIVHELAHAWAGNLVTNATWDDFWINEGTTVYLELRLNEALWGEERAAFLREWSHRELGAEIARMDPPDTRLRYEMAGRDPAKGVTVVPYLKGAALFSALEREVGRARLDAWLRGWFAQRAFQSVTTDDIAADLRAHLGLPEGFEWQRWVDEPGLLAAATPPASALLARVDALAARALEGATLVEADGAGLSPQALRHLLGAVLAAAAEPARAAGVMARLDAALGLSRQRNPEVRAPWLRLAARAEDADSAPEIERFLREQGRLKHLAPLYRELAKSEWGKPVAARAWAAAQAGYHALVRRALAPLFAG